MSRVVWASMVLVTSVVFACGGATTSATEEGPTTQDMERLCDITCRYQERCNPRAVPASQCSPSCIEKSVKFAAHARRDFAQAYASCLSELECDAETDACSREAADAIGETAAGAPDVQACRVKEATCVDARDFDNGVCDNLPFLRASSRSQMARCFLGSCEAVSACIEPVFGEE